MGNKLSDIYEIDESKFENFGILNVDPNVDHKAYLSIEALLLTKIPEFSNFSNKLTRIIDHMIVLIGYSEELSDEEYIVQLDAWDLSENPRSYLGLSKSRKQGKGLERTRKNNLIKNISKYLKQIREWIKNDNINPALAYKFTLSNTNSIGNDIISDLLIRELSNEINLFTTNILKKMGYKKIYNPKKDPMLFSKDLLVPFDSPNSKEYYSYNQVINNTDNLFHFSKQITDNAHIAIQQISELDKNSINYESKKKDIYRELRHKQKLIQDNPQIMFAYLSQNTIYMNVLNLYPFFYKFKKSKKQFFNPVNLQKKVNDIESLIKNIFYESKDHKISDLILDKNKRGDYVLRENKCQAFLSWSLKILKPWINIHSIYEQAMFGNGKVDFIVNDELIIEIKIMNKYENSFTSHLEQLSEYMRRAKCKRGILIILFQNFQAKEIDLMVKMFISPRTHNTKVIAIGYRFDQYPSNKSKFKLKSKLFIDMDEYTGIDFDSTQYTERQKIESQILSFNPNAREDNKFANIANNDTLLEILKLEENMNKKMLSEIKKLGADYLQYQYMDNKSLKHELEELKISNKSNNIKFKENK